VIVATSGKADCVVACRPRLIGFGGLAKSGSRIAFNPPSLSAKVPGGCGPANGAWMCEGFFLFPSTPFTEKLQNGPGLIREQISNANSISPVSLKKISEQKSGPTDHYDFVLR
jgi:hypothetical protein